MTTNPPSELEPNLSTPSLLADDDRIEAVDLELATEQILADPNLTQYITRRYEAGQDTLVGYFRCQLQPDQQRYALHVPLYPAMNRNPEIEAIVLDSDDASVRVTDRQKFGIRLEILVNRPKTEVSNVIVEVIAVCSDRAPGKIDCQ